MKEVSVPVGGAWGSSSPEKDVPEDQLQQQSEKQSDHEVLMTDTSHQQQNETEIDIDSVQNDHSADASPGKADHSDSDTMEGSDTADTDSQPGVFSSGETLLNMVKRDDPDCFETGQLEEKMQHISDKKKKGK